MTAGAFAGSVVAALRHPGCAVLAGIVVLCCVFEAALVGADRGFWGSAVWRPMAYQYGGFWAGLLHGWQPNYAVQPALMFLTHAFLHAGPAHLLGNMLTLGWLAPAIAGRLGGWRFAALYVASLLGGAAAFGVLTDSPSPMVGASGAIFGLAGAWIAWDWQDRRATGLRGWAGASRAVWIAATLAGFNLVVWLAQDGLLAWQTHLGGFVAGWSFATLPVGRHRRG